jgi:phosphoesterase RecJ-like protein
MSGPADLIPHLRGRVLIATHATPDGDAAGSVFGLSALVRALGGAPTCVFPRLPRVFDYLRPGHDVVDRASADAAFDAVFVVDCGSASQVADGLESLPAAPVLAVIDHHRTREPFGTVEWVDAAASATGVLVGELAQAAGVAFTAAIARPLWCAILTDTGSFRYSSTDGRTLRLGAALLDAGADPWEAAQSIYESHEPERQRLLGLCLGTLELRHGGRVAALHITREMAAAAGASMELSSGFINYARSIAGVEIAFLVRQDEELEDLWRVAFRSRGTHPVDQVAARFDGGGHRNAAGCRMTGEVVEIVERLFAATAALTEESP